MKKTKDRSAVTPPGKLLAAAVDAARGAGKILKDGLGTDFSRSTKSGPHDLFTEFDKLAEDLIESRLRRTFPSHAFLGEETGKTGMPESGNIRWIIDPIDGTLNFCRSIPYFCVSIAAECDGTILCGVILNPVTDELFTASRGGGAFLNGQRIHVSPTKGLRNTVMAIGFPFNTEGDPGHCLSYFAELGSRGVQLLRMGSTALNLAYVAAGRFDGFFETSSFPWDVAAGVLLVREAGGVVSSMDAGDFRLADKGIVATNKRIQEDIFSVIRCVRRRQARGRR